MKEAARRQRNQQRLTECFPKFAQRVKAVISDLEAQGFRPLIQDAHRSLVKIEFDPTHIEPSAFPQKVVRNQPEDFKVSSEIRGRTTTIY